jgi:hypothetical protein
MRRDLNRAAKYQQQLRLRDISLINYTKAGLGIPDKLAIKPLPQVGPNGKRVFFICWLEIKSKSGRLSETQEIRPIRLGAAEASG